MTRLIKRVTQEQYEHDAENGFGTFFDFLNYRLGEASRYTKINEDNEVEEDTLTYYIMDFSREETKFYTLTDAAMLEFLKINFCYNQEMKQELFFKEFTDLKMFHVEK